MRVCFVVVAVLISSVTVTAQQSSIIVGTRNGEWGGNGGVIFSLQPDGKNFRKLREYRHDLEGQTLIAPVTEASNGLIYGTAVGGGKYEHGVIFVNDGGTSYEVLKSFTAAEGSPRSNLLEISGQRFVGVIERDVTTNESEIFRINIDGTGFERIGPYPSGYANTKLLKVPDGIVGAAGPELFKLNNDGTGYRVIKAFPTASQQFQNDLYFPGDGYIYGLTYEYSLYRIKPDGSSYQVLHAFPSGQQVLSALAFVNGRICGSRYEGALFKVDLNGANYEEINTLSNGTLINSTSDGKLIFLNSSGETANIVKTDANGLNATTISTFASGLSPFFNVVRTSYGYYCTAQDGPKYGGLFFKFTDTGNLEILKEFVCPDGLEPQGDVIASDDGYIYGATQWGGVAGRGVVYRMLPDGSDYKVIKSFERITGGNGVSITYPNPLLASDGFLYGVHSYGGVDGLGSVYKLSRDGSYYSEIFSFPPTQFYRRPWGQLFEVDGKLVGTSSMGTDHGTLFNLNKDGTQFADVFEFPEYLGFGNMTKGLDGKLYGACRNGPDTKPKFFFRINGDGTNFTKIYDIPTADRIESVRLLYHSDGNLYGQGYITIDNASQMGIFKLAADGSSYKVIYKTSDTNNGRPYNSLTEGSDGFLYGRWLESGSGPTRWIFFKVKTDGTGFQKLYEDVTNPFGLSLSDLVFVPIVKTRPKITYTSITNVVKGSTIDLTAKSSSSGAITWGVTNMTGSATINGNKLTASNEGTVRVRIDVAGDDYYVAASTDVVIRIRNAAADLKKPLIWGTTVLGGAYNAGTIFSMNVDGSNFNTNYDFRIDGGGAMPDNTTLTNVNGKLYGTTTFGGAFDRGTIFSFDPATNAYSVEYSFKLNEAENVKAGLTLHSNGRLFGMSSTGGQDDFGTLFSFDPATKTCVIHHHFDDDDAYPRGNVVEVAGGAVFGLTMQGNIFKYVPSTNAFTNVKMLSADLGVASNGKLIVASDNKIYTTASLMGANQGGTILRIDPATGEVTSIFSFNPATQSSAPYGGLTEVNGKLYGTTTVRGTTNQPNGSIFSIDLTTLDFVEQYVFTEADGHFVTGNLVKATNGKLYGTTRSAGLSNKGTIFEFDPSNNNFKRVASLNQQIGKEGTNTPIAMADGKIIGLCKTGGSADAGTIFSYDPSTNTTKKLHEFVWREGGANPIGNLAVKDKTIYGAAISNNYDNSTIFKFDTSLGSYSELSAISQDPQTPGVVSVNLNNGSITGVYGSLPFETSFMYNYDLESNTTVVDHRFDQTEEGINPRNHLVRMSNGKYLGVTSIGGAADGGVIYEYDPSNGKYVVRYSFVTDTGLSPTGLLLKGDVVYGLCQFGGANNAGTVYSYNYKTSVINKLADFSADVGTQPFGALVEASNGKLYGLTTTNLATISVLFEFDPANSLLSKKHQFATATGLPTLSGKLIAGENGKVYGSISDNSTGHLGGIFEYDINKNAYRVVITFDGPNGSAPSGYFALMRGEQTIDFTGPTNLAVGGADVTLSATATSGLPLTYNSTSDKISISGNTVKGLKAGRVEVTASQDGGQLYNAVSKAASFCVNPAKPVITATDINTDHTSLKSNSDTGNQWYRNDELITGATASTFAPFLEGVYTLKVSVDGCVSEASESINIKVTGLEDPLSFISLSPNPADDEVHVMIADPDDRTITILLTDIFGRIAEQRSTRTNTTERFDIHSLAKGFYIFKVNDNGVAVSKKFIKK